MAKLFRLILLCLLCLTVGRLSYAASWLASGPNGGDARAFAADPTDHTHLYLGTATGWLYETHDGGASWARLARVGNRDDLVLDDIVVDSSDAKHLLVGAHDLGSDGGLYVSHDGGATWRSEPEMQGQSIRALTQAPSDPKILVAGSLSGVYRSTDRGEHWKLISPPGDKDIHEIESLAIDPKDPAIIYAGTWHLPWKTIDGGKHWDNITKGLIDDSDVFSIIVDPKQPAIVYLSACSGIYKSDDAGSVFHKVQGIPSTARRTRVLMQDPERLDTVFAGTTQGLYRTMNAGSVWGLLTNSEMIINDVYVDPTNSKHVLLATDRNGVMVSDDGAISFHHSNEGFSARQITAFAKDPNRPSTIYVGVVSDKEAGGVFMSSDSGQRWTQESSGLDGRDVFSLVAAPDGSILAGTGHGIARLRDGVWIPSSQLDRTPPAPPAKPVPKAAASAKGRGAAVAPARKAAVVRKPVIVKMNDTVYAMSAAGNLLYAATSAGLLRSDNSGKMWMQAAGAGTGEWRFVATANSAVVAAQLKKMVLSTDDGATWQNVPLPANLKQISATAVDGAGELWVGGPEGVYLSADKGSSWHTLKYLNVNDISDIYYDAVGNRVLVTSNRASTSIYAMSLATSDKNMTTWDTGWNLRLVRPVGGRFVGATLFDGIVLQPPDAKETRWYRASSQTGLE